MKVLITDHVHDLLLVGLRDLGYQVVYQPDLKLDGLVSTAHDCVGIVFNSKIKMTAERISSLPRLRFLARLGSGLEIVDLQAAHQQDIAVYSAPDGNCQAVGEHALGTLLSLFNRLCSAHRSVADGSWNREGHRGLELQGRQVGIIGFGHTGPALAQLLSGFGCEILVNDIVPKTLDHHPNCRWATIDEIKTKAEIVSLHVSYNASNHHMIDLTWLRSCAQPIYLINTSRGMVISLPDLCQAIRDGLVLGACLDVLENERPQTFTEAEVANLHFLADHPRVLLSPHVAGWTIESKERIASILLAKITRGAHLGKST